MEEVEGFIPHHADIDSTRPVPGFSKVVYRTVREENGENIISHIHAPVLASWLVWTGKPAIGRIFDYKVVG